MKTSIFIRKTENQKRGKNPRQMKGIIWFLVLCMTITSGINSLKTQARELSSEKTETDEYMSIIDEYYLNASAHKDLMITYQKIAVDKLTALGYEAYAISPTSYESVQAELKTNLEAMHISRNDYCIIIAGEKDGTKGAGASFSYTYDGTTYTLRTLIVTAADNSAYGKSSYVNVLSSKVKTVIQSCLNAAITTAAGAINSNLGTVATICGLIIDNFSFTQTSTMGLNCGTNWTRAYTQVYDSFYDSWYSGSCTEYVRQFSYMSGTYYSASTNGYVAVPTNQSTTYTYASNYTNTTWRREHAVLGYYNSYIYYDLTGSVKYYYNGSLKVTHAENF